MKPLSTFIISLSTAAIITGCGTDSDEPDVSEEQTESDTVEKEDVEEVEFPHMHGLGFTKNGEKAYVPAHDGLRVFEDGVWSRVEGPQHDYMGFTMTADGFYSSGHPSLQTDYENPLGIVKSTDEGKSIEVLGLEAEVDFHLMSAGYNSGAIYVMNPEPNSSMEDKGLYVTANEAKDWEKGDRQGVSGSTIALAAHPEQQETVALSTEDGVFLSEDAGDTFKQILSGSPVPALTFTRDGEVIAAVSTGEDTTLEVIDSSGESRKISVPEIREEDAVSYIAQNPKSSETIMVTTFERDIFYTKNGGETWQQLAEEGTAQNES